MTLHIISYLGTKRKTSCKIRRSILSGNPSPLLTRLQRVRPRSNDTSQGSPRMLNRHLNISMSNQIHTSIISSTNRNRQNHSHNLIYLHMYNKILKGILFHNRVSSSQYNQSFTTNMPTSKFRQGIMSTQVSKDNHRSISLSTSI